MSRPVYGYLKIAGAHERDEVAAMRAALTEFATRHGLQLAAIFTSDPRSRGSAFDELIAALKDSGVRDVVIPSWTHFARSSGLQLAMTMRIAHETGARVWATDGRPMT